jgi:uncharacterized repeat protein (TIGR03806 family)
MRALLLACVCLALALAARSGGAQPSDSPPAQLSAFGFFDGGANRPAKGLIHYRLGTPLFSDYAEKQRFISLPKGGVVGVDSDGRIQFPVGTALIKNFGYPDTSGEMNVIETRILLHKAEGWIALPYVWRADGSDADLKVGGTRTPVSFKTPSGAPMAISYAVPNKNQCKQCHSSKDRIQPIGPILQNMIFASPAEKQALLTAASMPRNALNADARWDDAKTGSTEQRALSYLRINCGHCHRPTGSASNSGLFFDDRNGSLAELGIGKRPVAAGRGSGNLDFVIDPGHPERSILIYRLKSTDPGIAMPELGRATVHSEGAALLEQWIREMKPEMKP